MSGNYDFLFKTSPVAMWIEDFSEIISHIKNLNQDIQSNLSTYLDKTPGVVSELILKRKIDDVNSACLLLFSCKSKSELLNRLQSAKTDPEIALFVALLSSLSMGQPQFEHQFTFNTPNGSKQEIRSVINLEQLSNNSSANNCVIVANYPVISIVDHQIHLQNISEDQVQQNQRLNSLSILARGVAHEINNPLTGLLNYATILEEEIRSPQLKTFAHNMKNEGLRVSEIVSNLLTFARPESSPKQIWNVLEVIEKAAMLINQSLRSDKIILDYSGVDREIHMLCQLKDIQQVLLNLISNSWQAILRKDDPRTMARKIFIHASASSVNKLGFVKISIHDFGDGIDKEDISNVFDPFFSGQPRTESVGLGLAVAYGIVREHGGQIEIKSTADVGTVVSLEMPIGNGNEG